MIIHQSITDEFHANEKMVRSAELAGSHGGRLLCRSTKTLALRNGRYSDSAGARKKMGASTA